MVTIPIRLCDLARYDPSERWVDRLGRAVTGAYVVDGGSYSFFAGDCVANPVLKYAPSEDPCTSETATKGLAVDIGRAGELYGVYL